MLSAGRTGWKHINLHPDTSARLPRDLFRHVFAAVQETLGGALDAEPGIEQLIKDAIHAAICPWPTPKHCGLTVETTPCTEDLLRAVQLSPTGGPGARSAV